ncbi:hypothetical protein [Streptomyces erythrochromogenes]|uniref:hypothetical protein n=1 Tax=Streptomyces erythrochromogenes TaxID=285574 RepID=UPI0036896A7E
MDSPGFDARYLIPLFTAVEELRGEGAYRTLPEPESGSRLEQDDAPLGPYAGSILIRSSHGAGVAHVDALRRLILAGEVDPQSPWTLLRGALENFATGVWLLGGKSPSERRRRALALWREDMRNRQQHEDDTGHTPTGEGQTGTQRRAEIVQLAATVGISAGALSAPKANVLLEEAARHAGMDPTQVRASWRVASGFAHGRYWPNLRAAQPRAAFISRPGLHSVALVIDETHHRDLAEHTHALLTHLHQRYRTGSSHS